MKFLQVNYARAISRDDAEQMAQLTSAAHKIAGVPGLLWKIWVYDNEARVAGGMYLFDSEESARAWGDGPMEPSLSAHPGIGDIVKRYFDVDEELSVITRAPLTGQEAASSGN